MPDSISLSRRTVVKGMGALPLAAALGNSGLVRAQNRTKVIVIGAGLSGLNAALLLEEQGVDVQVLEGRQRDGIPLEALGVVDRQHFNGVVTGHFAAIAQLGSELL